MKCKKLIICFGLLCSVFLSLFLSSDTFAIDDVTVTFGSESGFTSGYICGGNSSRNCSDYSFLYFSGIPDSLVSLAFSISGTSYSFQLDRVPFYGVSIDSTFSRIRVSAYYGTSYSFTLSGSAPGDCPEPPTGNLDITENGEYDVTDYATATVNVENEVIYGDYHDDLVAINNSILICAAVCLVIYFFYCFYRMIIRNSGVK